MRVDPSKRERGRKRGIYREWTQRCILERILILLERSRITRGQDAERAGRSLSSHGILGPAVHIAEVVHRFGCVRGDAPMFVARNCNDVPFEDRVVKLPHERVLRRIAFDFASHLHRFAPSGSEDHL